jgi:dihydropteroate synthase
MFFSIDTFRSIVASEALELGASIINDISAGGFDSEMLAVVGRYKAPYIAMHMQGKPSDMQLNPQYGNLMEELIFFFSEKIKEAHTAGINDLIIDPGFGFGKTKEHNFDILKNLEDFQNLNTPVLAGISRKSMIYKTLQVDAASALNGTTVLNTIALYKKAQIIRVHDVKEAKECIDLLEALQ